ncbi:hypothetical protein EVAR_92122_1 [Eumeta japonica]|uniref:Uncharacterized protein n=1 Tax=Eumeta variegata TaxID=151549 RepID=A0A4C1T1U5_EUMVA|nr:hypothetical protein EVAR_92122_1 [Eumeta japonica]
MLDIDGKWVNGWRSFLHLVTWASQDQPRCTKCGSWLSWITSVFPYRIPSTAARTAAARVPPISSDVTRAVYGAVSGTNDITRLRDIFKHERSPLT